MSIAITISKKTNSEFLNFKFQYREVSLHKEQIDIDIDIDF